MQPTPDEEYEGVCADTCNIIMQVLAGTYMYMYMWCIVV